MKTKFKIILALVFLVVFQPLVTAQDNCNCCTEQHKEFDFWLGSWNLVKPDGTIAGTNKIVKQQGNCIIRENFKSAKSQYTGTSINFYNTKSKQWEQIWTDNSGKILHLKGNRTGNKMILRSDDEEDRNGNQFYFQVTWTLNKAGSVRQYYEKVDNNGNHSVVFDGLYKKIK